MKNETNQGPLNTVNCKNKSAERDSHRCFRNHDTQDNLGGSKPLGFPLQAMVKVKIAMLDYNQNIQGINRVRIFKWDFFCSVSAALFISLHFCHCIYIKLDALTKGYGKKRKTNVV